MKKIMEWFILKREARDREYAIVSVPAGGDPLYGRGSWDLYDAPHSGPFFSSAAAENALFAGLQFED